MNSTVAVLSWHWASTRLETFVPCLPDPRSAAFRRSKTIVMTVNHLALAAAALGCLSAGALAEPTKYQLILENCGLTLTFQAAPERVVTVGQSTKELLYALGLVDGVVGASV